MTETRNFIGNPLLAAEAITMERRVQGLESLDVFGSVFFDLRVYCSQLLKTLRRKFMTKLLVRITLFALLAFLILAPAVAQGPKAKRINRAIELLSQGQPIYY